MNGQCTYSIEFLKSGLSVNTHIGCNLGCKYCVLSTSIGKFPKKPKPVKYPKTIIKYIMNTNSYFVNGYTPIYINNRTDPFLPEVIESTYELLELFVVKKIRSPIMIISKLAPDKRFYRLCEQLNILYFYTFANLKGIDYNSNDLINNSNLEKIKDNVPFRNRFHYYRPIIPGYNDSIKVFNDTVVKIKDIFNTTIIGGIRVNDINSKQFNIASFDRNHKYFDNASFEDIVLAGLNHSHHIVRHTSCAIALFMESNNKLNYFGKKGHCCMEVCLNYENCSSSVVKIDYQLIESIIQSNYSGRYEWSDLRHINFYDSIHQEFVAFLKTTFGISISTSEVILSPSEQKITSTESRI